MLFWYSGKLFSYLKGNLSFKSHKKNQNNSSAFHVHGRKISNLLVRIMIKFREFLVNKIIKFYLRFIQKEIKNFEKNDKMLFFSKKKTKTHLFSVCFLKTKKAVKYNKNGKKIIVLLCYNQINDPTLFCYFNKEIHKKYDKINMFSAIRQYMMTFDLKTYDFLFVNNRKCARAHVIKHMIATSSYRSLRDL